VPMQWPLTGSGVERQGPKRMGNVVFYQYRAICKAFFIVPPPPLSTHTPPIESTYSPG